MGEIYRPTNRETLEKWAEARPRGEGLKEGPMRIALALEHIAQVLAYMAKPPDGPHPPPFDYPPKGHS